MKIPINRELQDIALNHLSDTNFKDFTENILQKKCYFLVTDNTLTLHNSLRFR